MSSNQPVFESTASYYDSSSKKWKTGAFVLTNKAIQFHCDESEHINIPLHTVSGLEKRQSSFIYAALVVSVASNKHWFASFTNRDSAYNLIEIFWREALLSKEHKTASPRPKASSTNLGKDLMTILHESETTLVNAANSLSDQGQQLEETLGTVDDINTDLNVAERFIKNMSLTRSLFQVGNSSKTLDQQPQEKCFKVSFTYSELQSNSCYWKTGVLFVSRNVALVDEDKIHQFTIEFREIISLQVLSFWKLHLKYSSDGDAEQSCYIVCPKLEKLIRHFNSLPAVNGKIFYSEDVSFASSSHLISPTGSTTSFLQESASPERDAGGLVSKDEQAQELETVISDEDLQQITSMLNNLQDLASEISQEQKSQMEKIESLMSNVDRTELRMKADSDKIKKLT